MQRSNLSPARGPTARRNAGVAALEFGLLAPVFLILFAGIVDIGNALYTRICLEAAIATGANYALASAGNVTSAAGAALASSIATMVTTSNAGPAAGGTVVINNGPTVTVTAGAPSSGGTAANADQCYCPTGSPPNWAWGSAASCGSTCAGGGTAGKFVTITGSYNYTSFFSSYGLVPSGTITAGAMVQTQ
jgi:Flp pilus assembly protein TadG